MAIANVDTGSGANEHHFWLRLSEAYGVSPDYIQAHWSLGRVIKAHERLDIKAEVELEVQRLNQIKSDSRHR